MAVDIKDNLESPLRRLHEAIDSHLRATFGDIAVRSHSGQIDADTIRRYSQGAVALWPVIASARGSSESTPSELKVKVRWGIFIVASAMHVPMEGSESKMQPVSAVNVAESLANWVAQIAFNSRWGLQNSECTYTNADDLEILNPGVGLKRTKDFLEGEDLGFFIVWGTNTLTLGKRLLPGNEQLPLLEFMVGQIQDDGPGEELADIPIKDKLGDAFSAFARAAVGVWSRFRRWVFGPDRAEAMAALVNQEMFGALQ